MDTHTPKLDLFSVFMPVNCPYRRLVLYSWNLASPFRPLPKSAFLFTAIANTGLQRFRVVYYGSSLSFSGKKNDLQCPQLFDKYQDLQESIFFLQFIQNEYSAQINCISHNYQYTKWLDIFPEKIIILFYRFLIYFSR